MRSTVRRLVTGGEAGQAMVEFALIIIPFFLLVMGLFDLGRGIYASSVLSNAAREGARAGIVASRTADQLCGVALRATSPLLPGVTPPSPPACGAAGALAVAVLDRGTQGDPADPVQVRATYTFKLITPLIGRIVEQTPGCGCITLSATASMYVEN
jgi:hypothetical protein